MAKDKFKSDLDKQLDKEWKDAILKEKQKLADYGIFPTQPQKPAKPAKPAKKDGKK